VELNKFKFKKEMEEQFDLEPQQQPYGVMPPQYKEDRESPEIGVIRELSPRKVLEQLEMNLRGFFYDYELKKYVKKENYDPLMNEKAIAKFISVASAFISDIVTFSTYSIEEINARVQYVCESILPTFYINYQEYGIKEKSDLFLIETKVFVMCDAAFRKAMGGGDRAVIRGTLSENIRSGTINQMGGEKKGIFSRLNPFSR